MSRLRDALERDEFVITGEIAPPLELRGLLTLE